MYQKVLKKRPDFPSLNLETLPCIPYGPPEYEDMLRREEENARNVFNGTLNEHYMEGGGGYSRVGALLLTWLDDDMGCKEQTVRYLPQDAGPRQVLDHFSRISGGWTKSASRE